MPSGIGNMCGDDMFENIGSDLKRLSPNRNGSLRALVAGLLSQGFQAILVYRLFNWLHCRRISGQPLRFLCERFIEITTGISIPACCTIGKGLRIHHFGGIIFHPSVVIGENCTLYQGVTIGDRGGSGGAARIGNNVMIGAGAKLIGEITVGDNCRIGANTVVTRSMPDNTVAIGSPCSFKLNTVRAEPEQRREHAAPAVIRVMDLRGTYKGGGGPDKTVLNSAAQHDPEKVYVLVTYLRQPWDDEFQIPEMAHRLGINYMDVIDGSTVDWSCLRQLQALLRKHDLKLVHAHDDKTLLYGWLLKLMTPGLKIMYTCHSHAVHCRGDFAGPRDYLGFRLRQNMRIFLMKRYCRPIITVSHNTKQRLVDNGFAGHEVAVLHNGVDVTKWCRDGARQVLREEIGIPPGSFLVGTVARITPEKDLTTFFRVAEEVATQIPDVTFVIVGDGYGNELAKARDEIRGRGLDRLIRFTGHRNDLLNVYASFDVFLMTSMTEGMPNTLLEAMALGVPSVSTAVGGIPELLTHGNGGFLAPAGDVEGLARYVVNLLRDPQLRQRCGAACRDRIVERFSFSRRVRLMEDYYAWFAGRASLPEEAIPATDGVGHDC